MSKEAVLSATKSLPPEAWYAMGGVVVVFGLVWFVSHELGRAADAAGSAIKATGTAVNPLSQDNLANKTVGAVGKALTGSDSWTLGGQIYDWTHPNEQ